MGEIIHLDTTEVKKQLGEMVLEAVEQTPNAMMDAEADKITQAHKYKRTEKHTDTHAGHYHRKLMTKAREVALKIPKLRNLPFETANIERYRRREESVEEALIEMDLAGVSVRRVEDITEALWGTKVSPGTISNLSKKVYGQIEAWRNRPLVAEYPYVYMDGIYLKKELGRCAPVGCGRGEFHTHASFSFGMPFITLKALKVKQMRKKYQSEAQLPNRC